MGRMGCIPIFARQHNIFDGVARCEQTLRMSFTPWGFRTGKLIFYEKYNQAKSICYRRQKLDLFHQIAVL